MAKDLFGNEIEENVILRDKFVEPPFSVLDTRQGSWQARKRKWMNLGIKSETGRDKNLTHNIPLKKYDPNNMQEEYYERGAEEGTSVFDPALCEVLLRWFSPDGGSVLDPFAGGSVRGIVSNYLGYKYTGIELRGVQVEANRDQGKEILPGNEPTWIEGDSDKILSDLIENPGIDPVIKISRAMLEQRFQRCEPEYIKSTCRGRCCEGTNGLMVTIHPSEKERIEKLGAIIENGFIKDTEGNGICPFKKGGMCSIHEEKPLGCAASPFTLNKNDTLIIRNRYRILRCFKTPEAIPAYEAHFWSLCRIFGEEEATRIVQELKRGTEDIKAKMDYSIYKVLIENDEAKHPERSKIYERFDFVLSCPPYADLEVYSDHPDDLSNMPYELFLAKYQTIIRKTVQLMKPGAYAAWIVGEVRDKDGYFYDFVSDTKRAFIEAGAKFYNDAILLNVIGSASMRANKQFEAGKKLAKVHQNVLIFKK